eukprot:TRINITY_DN929_c0_g1_i5.p1 TRINITY_DN929_c0_g1~~TRINITY_DN929_c0_g1_i5.p1  ORF type:complete len:147 (-),score=36.61 TRINITY_DN929_c0_g1_i5:59-499(-)
MGKLVEVNPAPRMVYISASRAPPFLKRYLSTREEAERHLFGLAKLRAVVLKPGFIYSGRDRGWSVPLRYGIDIWNKTYGTAMQFVPKKTVLHDVLDNFNVDTSVALEDIATTSIVAAFDSTFDGQRLYNDDMARVRERFEKNGFKI